MKQRTLTKIGNLGRIITGKTPSTLNPDFYGGTIPFITPTDMVGTKTIVKTQRYLSTQGRNSVNSSYIPPHSICVSCIGSDMGKVVMTHEWAVTNQQINSIIVNESFDYRYIYYLMRTLENRIRNLGKNSTAVPILNKTKFSNIEINVFCDLEYQTRVADILSAYDDLIENNQKQIKLSEEAAQRLYKEWFIDLHFPGHETTPIVNGIPEGWTTNVLSDLFLTARGVSYNSADLEKPNVGALLVNLKNIKAWGGYNRGAEKSFVGRFRENQILCAGDIIMAVTDMTQERRIVGHVALVPTLNRTATFSMDIIKIIPKPNYTTNFLYAILRYSGIAEEISKHANGTNVLHLRPNCFDTISVIVPPQSIRKRFENLISDAYLLIDKLETQIFLAKEARDRLLPKLMSGEIEV